MKDVGLGAIVFGLAIVLKAGGGSVIAVADDHLVLDEQATYLTALAVGVLRPNGGHAEIAVIEEFLFGGHGWIFWEQPNLAAYFNTRDEGDEDKPGYSLNNSRPLR
jgi:hypothetical protein